MSVRERAVDVGIALYAMFLMAVVLAIPWAAWTLLEYAMGWAWFQALMMALGG
jgi:hypothetical protein